MLKRDRVEDPYVLILDRVIDLLAVPPSSDDLCLPEDSKLMRNRRDCHVEGSGDIANAEFTANQGGNYSDSGAIPEGFEKIPQLAQKLIVRHERSGMGDLAFMNACDPATIFIQIDPVGTVLGILLSIIFRYSTHIFKYMLKCSYCQ